MKAVDDILRINDERNAVIDAPFNPITGQGSIGKRVPLELSDFSIPVQWVPETMLRVPFIKKLKRAGSIKTFIENTLKVPYDDESRDTVIKAFVKERTKHDFPFWAALYVYIKNKGGGDDVLFNLTIPQRDIVALFEAKRLQNLPIRVILLKARQLGGSTVIQIYMSWLQLVHQTGLNSLIISLQTKASDEIYDMFCRMIKAYPVEMLHSLGDTWQDNEPKFVGVGVSGAIHRVPQRNCKIKLGSAEKPDSCRGGDYNLVHLSEVGLWKKTDGKSPEDIVRSACRGIALKPYTMIVYESTPKGTGNFFHREYTAAKSGRSLFTALFIPWYRIPLWSQPFDGDEEKRTFALRLWENRMEENADSEREEPGRYLWWLWEKGATLEGIKWYIQERSGCSSHSKMASEFPSDDVEAFTDLDNAEFDRYLVEQLRPSCRAPRFIGEVYGYGDEGEDALSQLRFRDDDTGKLWVWAKPEIDRDEEVTDRYLVVVDIGGHSDTSDWSVICVFDRMMMMDGGIPAVVAQWYGHTDMDILAWKSAQIAAWYDNALLVIESNTLETHDRDRNVDGDQSAYILALIKDVYPNLYVRKQSAEDIRAHRPAKYGFHTNVKTKPEIISTLKKAVRDSLYTERDERCLHEMLVYERKPNGAFGAVPGEHDDLLMTRAIGLHICYHEMDLPEVVKRVDLIVRTVSKEAVSAATM